MIKIIHLEEGIEENISVNNHAIRIVWIFNSREDCCAIQNCFQTSKYNHELKDQILFSPIMMCFFSTNIFL